MPEKKLSIIVPVYNEEAILAVSLPAIFALAAHKEVIVVNDGSTDNSRAMLEGLLTAHDFQLLNQPVNCGKGAAIKKGLEAVSGDYFVICDADLEYDPQDIAMLFSKIKNEANGRLAVYGSRFLNYKPFAFYYAANWFLTAVTNILFKSNLTDMETCLKLVPVAALKDIRLSGRHFEIEPEITAQLLKAGYRIKEFPISYARRGYKEGKKIKAKDGFLALKTLFREKFSV
jgi:glycosyltransferase involved in cell wall biosynthesis